MTNTAEESHYIKKAELARALGVSARTIDNWLAKRTIPYIAVSARLHLFDLAKVKAALEERFGVEVAQR